jgi:hypothetical protein
MAAQAPTPRLASVAANTTATDAAHGPDPLSDVYDPANYVCVSEQTTAAKTYPLFGNPGECARTMRQPARDSSSWTRPSIEVDHNSRVLIRFNRERLRALGSSSGSVTISGSLTKSGVNGGHPVIEIPGYNQIGQAATASAVHIRNADQVVASFREAATLGTELGYRIRVVRVAVADSLAAFDSTTRVRATHLRQSIDSVGESLTAAQTLLARRSYVKDSITHLLAIPDSNLSVTANRNDTLASVSAQIASLGFRIDSLTRRRSDSSTQLGALRVTADKQGAFDHGAAPAIAREITARMGTLLLVLKSVATPTDSVAMDRMLAVMDVDGRLLRAEASGALASTIPAIMDTTRPQADRVSAADQLLNVLTRLAALSPSRFGTLADSIRAGAVQDVRDAMIDLHDAGAEVGDQIMLVVTFGDPVSGDRQLRLRLEVHDFGLIPHVEDSFLFLSRQISQPQPVQDIGPSRSSVRYNYEATAGATLGWTYSGRRQWGGRLGAVLLRWLDPGFGINVSFPKFATRVVAIQQTGSPALPAPVVTTDGGADVQIGVGFVASFFNGAVQLTWGRNLMAEFDQRYWGVGFSFVKIVGQVKDALAK